MWLCAKKSKSSDTCASWHMVEIFKMSKGSANYLYKSIVIVNSGNEIFSVALPGKIVPVPNYHSHRRSSSSGWKTKDYILEMSL